MVGEFGDVLATMTQFGVAGMMGAMWLVERRVSANRESQLTQAHRALTDGGSDRSVLTELVRENTRAITLLEASQRGLIDALTRRRTEQAEPR